MLNILLNDLQPLSIFDSQSGEYEPLHFHKVEEIREEAVRIDSNWYPKSLLRCDEDGDIWVEEWFLDEKREDIPNDRD